MTFDQNWGSNASESYNFHQFSFSFYIIKDLLEVCVFIKIQSVGHIFAWGGGGDKYRGGGGVLLLVLADV